MLGFAGARESGLEHNHTSIEYPTTPFPGHHGWVQNIRVPDTPDEDPWAKLHLV
jgi:hypothetical protein